MKIILSHDVPNLGEEGDVCVVKNGYARNYLLPTGAAVSYNRTNLAIVASRADAIEKRKEVKRKDSSTVKEKLDKLTLKLVVSAGESGKLFGSVTSMMIQQELAKQGIEVEKKRIEIATRAIKSVGEYTIRIHLYEKEFSIIKLIIESEALVKRQKMEAEKKATKEKAVAKLAEKKEAAKTAEKKEIAEAKAVAEAKVAKAKEITPKAEVVEEAPKAEVETEKAEDTE